jgi:hypothetical protein
MTPFVT